MTVRRMLPLGCAALSMVMFAGVSMMRADDAPATAPSTQPVSATGTVSITILDASNNPVTDAKVHLMNTADMPKHGQHNGGEKGKRPKGIEATLGSDGKYTATVPVGDYIVMVNDKTAGRGREKVSVTANATASVTVNLKQGGNKNNNKNNNN